MGDLRPQHGSGPVRLPARDGGCDGEGPRGEFNDKVVVFMKVGKGCRCSSVGKVLACHTEHPGLHPWLHANWVMVCTITPAFGRWKPKGEFKGNPLIHSEFEVSLEYIKTSSQNNKPTKAGGGLVETAENRYSIYLSQCHPTDLRTIP